MPGCISCGRDAVIGRYCSSCHKKAFPIPDNSTKPIYGLSKYDLFFQNLEDISKNCAGWGPYYQLLGGKVGYCFGLSILWGSAILHNDLTRYYRRLDYLTHNYQRDPFKLSRTQSFRTLSALINYVTTEYRTKIGSKARHYQEELKLLKLKPGSVDADNLFDQKYKSKYTQETSALEEKVPGYKYILEIRAFLDSLLLYQDPRQTSLYIDSNKPVNPTDRGAEQHTSLYQTPPFFSFSGKNLFSQNALITSFYLENDTIGTLRGLFNRPYAFNKIGWKFFLDQLFHAVKEIEQPIFINLNSAAHAVGLFVPPNGRSFVLYDPNFMLKNHYDEENGCVYDSFPNDMEGTSSEYLALNIAVYTSSKAVIPPSKLDPLRTLSEGCTYSFAPDVWANSLILYVAVTFNHIDVLRDLLDTFGSTPNPNQCTATMRTPLLIACAFGYKEIVEFLAQSFGDKINPNVVTDQGVTPLFAACGNGHSGIVKQLLESFRGKVNPNITRKDGMTPLYIACQNAYSDVILILFHFFTGILKRASFILREVDVYKRAGGNDPTVIRNLETLPEP